MTWMSTRVRATTYCNCLERSVASLNSLWYSEYCLSAGSIDLTQILSWCRNCTRSRLMSSNLSGASSRLVRCTMTTRRRAAHSRSTDGRRWGIIWSSISRVGCQSSDPVSLHSLKVRFVETNSTWDSEGSVLAVRIKWNRTWTCSTCWGSRG